MVTMQDLEDMVRGVLVIAGGALTVKDIREGILTRYRLDVDEQLVLAAVGARVLAGDVFQDTGLGVEDADHVRYDVRDTFRRAYRAEHERWKRLGVLRGQPAR